MPQAMCVFGKQLSQPCLLSAMHPHFGYKLFKKGSARLRVNVPVQESAALLTPSATIDWQLDGGSGVLRKTRTMML